MTWVHVLLDPKLFIGRPRSFRPNETQNMDSLAKHAEEAIGAGAANAADKKGTFAVKVPPPPLFRAPLEPPSWCCKVSTDVPNIGRVLTGDQPSGGLGGECVGWIAPQTTMRLAYAAWSPLLPQALLVSLQPPRFPAIATLVVSVPVSSTSSPQWVFQE